MIEVYMYDYIVLAIPWIRAQLDPVANAVKTGIRDVLPKDNDDDEDAISLKFVWEKEGAWSVINNILGFDFDGNQGEPTIWITHDCRNNILENWKVDFGRRAQKKRYPFWGVLNINGKTYKCLHFYNIW